METELAAAWPAQDGSGHGIERQLTINTAMFHGFAGHAKATLTSLTAAPRWPGNAPPTA